MKPESARICLVFICIQNHCKAPPTGHHFHIFRAERGRLGQVLMRYHVVKIESGILSATQPPAAHPTKMDIRECEWVEQH